MSQKVKNRLSLSQFASVIDDYLPHITLFSLSKHVLQNLLPMSDNFPIIY